MLLFSGPTDVRFLGSEKIPISVIYRLILFIVTAECGYQVLVTKTCNGGRISYILTNFIPKLSVLKGKHDVLQLLNNMLQTAQLNNYKLLVQAFFPALKTQGLISA